MRQGKMLNLKDKQVLILKIILKIKVLSRSYATASPRMRSVCKKKSVPLIPELLVSGESGANAQITAVRASSGELRVAQLTANQLFR